MRIPEMWALDQIRRGQGAVERRWYSQPVDDKAVLELRCAYHGVRNLAREQLMGRSLAVLSLFIDINCANQCGLCTERAFR